MGKRKKRRKHSGSGGSSSNSSDTKLVSSVLNETNTVLHGETVMQSSAQLNAPVQHLAMSTPAMNSQQQYMQMLNSPILSPCYFVMLYSQNVLQKTQSLIPLPEN